jgi:Cytochrome P460
LVEKNGSFAGSGCKFIYLILTAMRKYPIVLAIIILFITGAGFKICSSLDYEVPYPEGYRKWTHIKTGLIGPENPAFKFSGGFHHIYGNDKAMQGYTSGVFPDGAILVFDVIEAVQKDGSSTEGKRTHIDVMYKDASKYAATGGWGYEEFKVDSKIKGVLSTDTKTNCFNCHAKQDDFVFSMFRE